MDDVESGRAGAMTGSAESPALIVFVRAIGLDAGDVGRAWSLRAPDGSVLASQAGPPLAAAKAQWLSMLGRKRAGALWTAGNYLAEYKVTRHGGTVLSRQFALAIP